MDDLQTLLAEIRELVHPKPKPSKAPKIAALMAGFAVLLGLIKFIVAWCRVPTMPKAGDLDAGQLGRQHPLDPPAG